MIHLKRIVGLLCAVAAVSLFLMGSSDDASRRSKYSVVNENGVFRGKPGESITLTPDEMNRLKKKGGVITFRPGYLANGNDYLKLPNDFKIFWCAGLYDAVMVSSLMGVDYDLNVKWLLDLTKDMPGDQFASIITVYITNHPEIRDLPANWLALKALTEAHEKRFGFKPKFAITQSL